MLIAQIETVIMSIATDETDNFDYLLCLIEEGNCCFVVRELYQMVA